MRKINISNYRKLCFDLDGVICETKNNNYKKSKPKIQIIKKINSFYDYGFEIIIFTARFMGRNNDKKKYAIKAGLELTKNQLARWGLKYHRLIMGKPSYDIIIDDKALGFKKDWYKKLIIN